MRLQEAPIEPNAPCCCLQDAALKALAAAADALLSLHLLLPLWMSDRNCNSNIYYLPLTSPVLLLMFAGCCARGCRGLDE
jgi:hypothetical protein